MVGWYNETFVDWLVGILVDWLVYEGLVHWLGGLVASIGWWIDKVINSFVY